MVHPSPQCPIAKSIGKLHTRPATPCTGLSPHLRHRRRYGRRVPAFILIAILWFMGITLFRFAVSHPTALGSGTPGSPPILSVPGDIPDLQTAIDAVPPGGIIELADGIYPAPPGGFRINNKLRSFTIRAATDGQAILDGQGRTDILRFQNTERAQGKRVVFQGLTFANGVSTEEGVAGGVTIHYAEALFLNCRFVNNTGRQATTGGGAVLVTLDSTVTFVNCLFEDNTARNEGGALAVNGGQIDRNTVVRVVRSRFSRNHTLVAGHRSSAAGGAIHVGNAMLRVTDSIFEDNRSCIGGAIYGIGTWDESRPYSTWISINNSTFQSNQAVELKEGSCAFVEGGALHLEDATTAEILNSRFLDNRSDIGGAINSYRAELRVERSYFEANYAYGRGPGRGFGGAIAATSNDVNDASTNWGAVNRRPALVTISDSVFRGDPTRPGQTAAGVYVAGDTHRMYGLRGVERVNDVEKNRARLTVRNSVFLDTDVAAIENLPGSGVGGAITVDLAQVQVSDVIIVGSDAQNSSNASGGGIAVLNNSNASMERLAIVRSSADGFGGALFVQGSHIELKDCILAENTIGPSPGETDPAASFGAAIFTGPDPLRALPVTGVVQNCLIADNIGQPIFDDDRTEGPINAVVYNNNRIHTSLPGGIAYTNSIAFQCCKTVEELNQLVIRRKNGTSTDKAAVSNVALPTAPSAGMLLLLREPPILSLRENYLLAYAWTGTQATLDNTALRSNGGVVECGPAGCARPAFAREGVVERIHILEVDGRQYTVRAQFLDREIFLPHVARTD